MALRLIYSGRLDVDDGYQLGDPDLGAVDPESPITVTTDGIIVTTGSDIDAVVLEVHLEDNAPADACDTPSDMPQASRSQVFELQVGQPWDVFSWDVEPPTPAAPPLLGPGRWRIAWSASAAQPADVTDSDLAEYSIEKHVLILTPLDDLARSWQIPVVEAVPDTSRDDVNSGAFLRTGKGTWALSWSTDPDPQLRTISPNNERVELVDGALLTRFDRKSEITLSVRGRSWYEDRMSRLLGEKWVVHGDAAVPAGRDIRVLNAKGAPARGVEEVVATGPARLVVALRHPDSHDLVDVRTASGATVTEAVYDRDMGTAQDARFFVLLE